MYQLDFFMKKPKRIPINCSECGGIMPVAVYDDDRFFSLQECTICNKIRIVQPDPTYNSPEKQKKIKSFMRIQIMLMKTTEPWRRRIPPFLMESTNVSIQISQPPVRRGRRIPVGCRLRWERHRSRCCR